jgi:hypothetical protein
MNVRDESLPADLQKRIDDEKRNVKLIDHYVGYPLNLSSNIHWAPDALVYVVQFHFIVILIFIPFLCISLDANQCPMQALHY